MILMMTWRSDMKTLKHCATMIKVAISAAWFVMMEEFYYKDEQ